jgi:amino acid adenylation domain-containing protein
MQFEQKKKNYNIAEPFYRNARRDPDRIAISAMGVSLSYGEAMHHAQSISAWLQSSAKGKVGRVGIVASRSIMACLGVLGTAWSGGTYVPIGLKLPDERFRRIISLSQLDALITDESGAALLSEEALAISPPHILVPRERSIVVKHPHICSLDSLTQWEHAPVHAGPKDIAYIEFTSGTTGTPKGVMICAGGVHQYISVIQERYQITPEDRLAETADLSFDISVSNMFGAWNAGASLHIIPSSQAMAPVRFIQDNSITYWYSVPSIITFLNSMKVLSPAVFPSLRCSIFAGEPFPVSASALWRRAAPNSIIDNLYGPTEATVVCLGQRVSDPPVTTAERGIIAIGKPFPGTEAAILSPEMHFLLAGQEGEIALAGGQLAAGYFDAQELTADRFRVIEGKRWYLTGDKGFMDSSGVFHHLGRFDHQVKVLGNRVELEEIEAHLRKAACTELVAAVAWPVEHGVASGVVGFVSHAQATPAKIRDTLRKQLPAYMMPTVIHETKEMPMTVSGKVDRKALLARLDRTV